MPTLINKYHKQLLDKKEELLLALRDRGDLKIETKSADPLDEAMASSARITAAEGITRNTELLRRVKKALDKLLHGEFGECEGCGEVIKEARLNVVPWAENCIHCQHQEEQRGGV